MSEIGKFIENLSVDCFKLGIGLRCQPDAE